MMAVTKKIGTALILGILFIIMMLGIRGNVILADTFPNYTFKIGTSSYTESSPPYEITRYSTELSITATDWANAPYDVQWSSTDTGVVTTDPTTSKDTVNLIRKGPGYSTIKARVYYKDSTTFKDFYFLVWVDMKIDYNATGTISGTTEDERYLILQKNDSDSTVGTRQIKLKYVDYTQDDGSTVTGSAITAASFKSSNPAVVSVGETTGLVTAVGGGEADITITSNTVSSDGTPIIKKLKVFVVPSFNLNYIDNTNSPVSCISRDNSSPLAFYDNIPSTFDIKPNTSTATNLDWKVLSVVGNNTTEEKPTTSSKLSYTVDSYGMVHFSGVKPGTYEIIAYVHSYREGSYNVPYAIMKIYVPPVKITDKNIVMNVHDTYNILDDFDLPGMIYNIDSSYRDGVTNLDRSSYEITANSKGTVEINLTYNSTQTIMENYGNAIPQTVKITVTVIDGIGVSMDHATLYTGGKLQLYPVQTDSRAVTWSSSNPEIAKVDSSSGLVTAVKEGYAKITVSQKFDNGVVKKATCSITVQKSVESIDLGEDNVTLAIDGRLTLHATITPSNLSGVTLRWQSSNTAVVDFAQPVGALDATIIGKTGGRAVICAINQDNVVVGYCHVTVQQPVKTISLSQTSALVDLSMKNLQLTATINPDNATNQAIKWTSTDTSKATVNSATGLVTFIKPGTVTIVATSVDNPAAVAYCNVTIQTPVASLSLDEATKTMYVGQTARLTYVVLPANASNNMVSWTSTNPKVATVDSSGLVTAKSVGTTVIALKSLDGGNTVYSTITVKQAATGVKFDVQTLALKSGEYYYLKSVLTPNGSTENSITWESSDSKVAIVDSNGKITAKDAGTCVIMARTESGAVAYCKVTVSQSVSGLILNYSEKTIYKGEKFDLDVSVSPSTASKLDVTWKSSNTKIASVSGKGEVEGKVGGTAIITCTTVDGGYAATCVVTVKETVTSVKLNHSSYKIGVKKTVTLKATVKTETATNKNVKWKSSNTKIAVVSQKGKVTALRKGYATITATAKDGSDADATCEIRVVTAVRSIKVSRSTMTLFIGSAKKLTVKVKPTNATYKSATWSTSNKKVANVTSDGTVIAIKKGNATITAKAKDSSGKRSICYVTVLERVPSTGVTLQDKAITMVPGEAKSVNVVLLPANSTDSKKWSTDNATVASVNKKTGRITAKSTGTAYITVMTASGKTATVEVTVIGLNIHKLVTEEYTSYPTALSVEGATSTVSWRSDNPMIAVVYSDGTVSTRGAGTATITATVNGRRLSCTVVVKRMS